MADGKTGYMGTCGEEGVVGAGGHLGAGAGGAGAVDLAGTGGGGGCPLRLNPLADGVFLNIFSRPGAERALEGLIGPLLDHAGLGPLGQIESCTAEAAQLGGALLAKAPRMDVEVVTARWVVDVEAQRRSTCIVPRFQFYGSLAAARHNGRGTGYAELRRAVVIVLLEDQLAVPGDPGFVQPMEMRYRNDPEQPCESLVTVLFVELPKFRALYPELTDGIAADEMLSWLYTLSCGYRREADMEVLEERFPSIEEFAKLYGLAIDDPQCVLAWEVAADAHADRISELAFAREEGMAEGRAEGRAELVEKWRAQGMSQEEIDALLA